MSEKCNPDDPRRCQGVTRDGQCEYLASDGSQFCDFHNSGAAIRRAEMAHKNRYVIEREGLKTTYDRHNRELDYLDMRDEITLLQGMLERRLNMATSQAEEMEAYRAILGYIQRLESMKINLMKIQQQIGLVLGKDELRILAKRIADILDIELEGVDEKEDRMERICEQLFEAIEQAGRSSNE